MDAVRIGKAIALGSLSALLLAGASVLVQVSVQLHRVPTIAIKAEAALDYTARAAKHVDDAAGVWAEASRTESEYLHTTLPALTAQAETTMQQADALLGSLRQTSDSANLAVQQATVFEQHTDDHLQGVLSEAQHTLATADTLVGDPHIRTSLEHVDSTTAAAAESMRQAAAILADARTTADKYQKRRPWLLRIFGF